MKRSKQTAAVLSLTAAVFGMTLQQTPALAGEISVYQEEGSGSAAETAETSEKAERWGFGSSETETGKPAASETEKAEAEKPAVSKSEKAETGESVPSKTDESQVTAEEAGSEFLEEAGRKEDSGEVQTESGKENAEDAPAEAAAGSEETEAKPAVQISGQGTDRRIRVETDLSAAGLNVAVWSRDNGQDDIRWYSLKKQEDGSWAGTIPGQNIRHSGICFAHVYTDKNLFVGAAEFSMAEEEVSSTKLQVTGSGSLRTLEVSLGNRPVKGVQAAIWSAEGGQDDIQWITLTGTGEGRYAASVPVKKIRHAGLCYVHFYTTDFKILGSADFTLDSEDLTRDPVRISESGRERIITAEPEGSPSSVRAAVWSEKNGQDDLKWYTLKKNGDGTWTVSTRGEQIRHSGTCFVHVYADNNRLVGTAFFTVAEEELAEKNKVEITGSGSSRTALARLADSGVKGVNAAIWSAEGSQDDLKWYSLKKQKDGTWSCSVDLRKLKHSGTCYAHFYTADNRFVGAVTFDVKKEEGPVEAVRVSGSGSARTVTVTGTYKNASAAVWSAEGGQDDLKWYSLKKQKDGTWKVSVPLGNLKHEGTVYVHCYGNNNKVFVGAAAFSWEREFRVVSHRGYSEEAPENTLAAYRLAKEKGYTYVEADVSFTADGVPVLLHDTSVDRTSDGTGSVSDLTLNELGKLDFDSWKSSEYAGERIPTLEAFLQLCKETGLKPYVELKSKGGYTREQIRDVVQLVKSREMLSDTTFISFSSSYLSHVKEVSPESRLGFLKKKVLSDALIETAKKLRSGKNEVFLDVQAESLTEEGIRMAKKAGIPLEVWTVDDTDTVKNLDPYITGITTNRLTGDEIGAARKK